MEEEVIGDATEERREGGKGQENEIAKDGIGEERKVWKRRQKWRTGRVRRRLSECFGKREEGRKKGEE